MSLPCHVQMEDQGRVGEDDGEHALWSTSMRIVVAGRSIEARVLTDSYSGKATSEVQRDPFRMPNRLIEPLLVSLYWACSTNMRQCCCEIGEAFCDLESFVRRVFYRADAEELIRKLRATAPASTSVGTRRPN
jgi:hypothetical protein